MRRPPRWLKDLGNTPDSVFVVAQSQHILTWNEAAEKLFGRRACDAIGHRCFNVVGGQLRGGERFCRAACRVQRCLCRGSTVGAFDLRTRTALGDIWVTVTITRLQTRSGPLALHTVRHSAQRDRSQEAIGEIVASLRAYGFTPQREPGGGDETCCYPEEKPASPLSTMSRREMDVVNLLLDGRPTAEIASTLGVSLATTRCHIRNMLKKAGVHSRAELVSLALRHRR